MSHQPQRNSSTIGCGDMTTRESTSSHEHFTSISSPLAATSRPPPISSIPKISKPATPPDETDKTAPNSVEPTSSAMSKDTQVNIVLALILISSLAGLADSKSSKVSGGTHYRSLLAAGVKAVCAAVGVAVALKGRQSNKALAPSPTKSSEHPSSTTAAPLSGTTDGLRSSESNFFSPNSTKKFTTAEVDVELDDTEVASLESRNKAEIARQLRAKPEVRLVLGLLGDGGGNRDPLSTSADIDVNPAQVGSSSDRNAPFPSLAIPPALIQSIVDSIALTEAYLIKARTTSIEHSVVAKAAMQELREEHERRQQEREVSEALTKQESGGDTHARRATSALPYFPQSSSPSTRLNSDEQPQGPSPNTIKPHRGRDAVDVNNKGVLSLSYLAKRSRTHDRRDSVGSMMLAVCHSSGLLGTYRDSTPTPIQSALPRLQANSTAYEFVTSPTIRPVVGMLTQPYAVNDNNQTKVKSRHVDENASPPQRGNLLGDPLQPPTESRSASTNADSGEFTLPVATELGDIVQKDDELAPFSNSNNHPAGQSISPRPKEDMLTSPSAISLYSSAPPPSVPLDVGAVWHDGGAPSSSLIKKAMPWPPIPSKHEKSNPTINNTYSSPNSAGSSANNSSRRSRGMGSGRWPLPTALPPPSKGPSTAENSFQFSTQTPMGNFLPIVTGSTSTTMPITPPSTAARWPAQTHSLHPQNFLVKTEGGPATALHFSPLRGDVEHNNLNTVGSLQSTGQPTPTGTFGGSQGGPTNIITGGIFRDDSPGIMTGESSKSLVSTSVSPAKLMSMPPKESTSGGSSSLGPRPSLLSSPLVPTRNMHNPLTQDFGHDSMQSARLGSDSLRDDASTTLAGPSAGPPPPPPPPPPAVVVEVPPTAILSAAEVSPSASASESVSLMNTLNQSSLVGITSVMQSFRSPSQQETTQPATDSAGESIGSSKPQTDLTRLRLPFGYNLRHNNLHIGNAQAAAPLDRSAMDSFSASTSILNSAKAPPAIMPMNLTEAMASAPTAFHSQTGSAFRSFEGGSDGGGPPTFLASGSTAMPSSPLPDRPFVISSSVSSSSHNVINIVRVGKGRGMLSREDEQLSREGASKGVVGALPIMVPPSLVGVGGIEGLLELRGSRSGVRSATGTFTDSLLAEVSAATFKNTESSPRQPEATSTVPPCSLSASTDRASMERYSTISHHRRNRATGRISVDKITPDACCPVLSGSMEGVYVAPLPFLSFVPTSNINSDEVGSPIEHSDVENDEDGRQATANSRWKRYDAPSRVAALSKESVPLASTSMAGSDGFKASSTSLVSGTTLAKDSQPGSALPFLSFQPLTDTDKGATYNSPKKEDEAAHSNRAAPQSSLDQASSLAFLRRGEGGPPDSVDGYSAQGSGALHTNFNFSANPESNLSPFSAVVDDDEVTAFGMMIRRSDSHAIHSTSLLRPALGDAMGVGNDPEEDDDDEVDDTKRLSFSDDDSDLEEMGSRVLGNRQRAASAAPHYTIPSVVVVGGTNAFPPRRTTALQLASTSSTGGSFSSNVNYIVSQPGQRLPDGRIRYLATNTNSGSGTTNNNSSSNDGPQVGGASAGMANFHQLRPSGGAGFSRVPSPQSVFSHMGSAAASLSSPYHPWSASNTTAQQATHLLPLSPIHGRLAVAGALGTASSSSVTNQVAAATTTAATPITSNSTVVVATVATSSSCDEFTSPLVHKYRSNNVTMKPSGDINSIGTPSQTPHTFGSANSAEGLGLLVQCGTQSSDNIRAFGSNSMDNFSGYVDEVGSGSGGMRLSTLAGRLGNRGGSAAAPASLIGTTSSLDLAGVLSASPKGPGKGVGAGHTSAEQSHTYPMPTFEEVAEVEALLSQGQLLHTNTSNNNQSSMYFHQQLHRVGSGDDEDGIVGSGGFVRPTASTVSLFLDSGGFVHNKPGGKGPVLLSSSASYSQPQGVKAQQQGPPSKGTNTQLGSPVAQQPANLSNKHGQQQNHLAEMSDNGIHSPLEILSITSGLRPSFAFGNGSSAHQHLLFLQSLSNGGDQTGTQSSDHVISILAPSAASSLARPVRAGNSSAVDGPAAAGASISSGSSGMRFLGSGTGSSRFGLGFVNPGSGMRMGMQGGILHASALFGSNLSGTVHSSGGSSVGNRAIGADRLDNAIGLPPRPFSSVASMQFSSPETFQSGLGLPPMGDQPNLFAPKDDTQGHRRLTSTEEDVPSYSHSPPLLAPSDDAFQSKSSSPNEKITPSPKEENKEIVIDMRPAARTCTALEGQHALATACLASPTVIENTPPYQAAPPESSASSDSSFNKYRFNNRSSGLGLLPSFASAHDAPARQGRSFVYLHRKRRKLFDRRSQLIWTLAQNQPKGDDKNGASNASASNSLPYSIPKGSLSAQPSQALLSHLPPTAPEGPLPKTFVDGKGLTWLIGSHCLGTGGFGKVMVGVALNTRKPCPSHSGEVKSKKDHQQHRSASIPPTFAVAVKAVWLAGRSERDMFSLARELEVLAYVDRMQVGIEGLLQLADMQEEAEKGESSNGSPLALSLPTKAQSLPAIATTVIPSLRLIAEGFQYLVGHHSSALSSEQGHLLITMGLLQGGSLSSILKRFGSIGIEAVRRHLREVLIALRTLHGIGLMHRDVKPANMLLKTVGDFGFDWVEEMEEGQAGTSSAAKAKKRSCCCLADLGTVVFGNQPDLRQGTAAPLTSADSLNTAPYQSTMPAAALEGTIPYMAPEACMGAPTYASDIWSIGITCVELLTGTMPWPPLELSYPKMILSRHGRDPVTVPTWREVLPAFMKPVTSIVDTELLDAERSSSPSPHDSSRNPDSPSVKNNNPSSHVYNFLELCLNPNASERPSAHELLSHPFLRIEEM